VFQTSSVENVLHIFEERGFVEQVTDRSLVAALLKEPVTCYIGFDPTAKSFHAGSLLPIMALVHMQRGGHRPIAVIGGGTALVGDPSGKTEMRPIMTREQIRDNAACLKEQLARFIDFSEGNALMVDNADWLTRLNYIDFLRDIGRHFSVNRMLSAESYKARLETGLSFIEFNYMLLQAYDFWHLFKTFDCRLQMGGNDQWGNILAGADLTRRMEGEIIHGLTFPLLTTSSGIKMGKTHKGAIWLDPELTSPYDYYQYWINQDDADVGRFLSFFTLLPMDDIRRLQRLEGSDIRQAKEILAYEATRLCHGREAADQAQKASRELFGSDTSLSSESVPVYRISQERLGSGVPSYILFEDAGLCKTRGEARRLIAQGGGYVNGQKIQTFDQVITEKDMKDHSLLLRAGKKRYMKVVLD
jgi:tyrosyl-tRNA synthetase